MDITSICVTGIIFVTLYKVIYLLVRRRERLMLIEKLDRLSMTPPEFQANLEAVSRDLGSEAGSVDLFGAMGRFTALRWGAGAFGAGLGMIVAFFINLNVVYPKNYYGRGESVVFGGCLLLFIGLALLLAFVVELRLRRSAIENAERDKE